MSTSKKGQSDNQIAAFRKIARELECDESEERFDAALRRVAKSQPAKPGKTKRKESKK